MTATDRRTPTRDTSAEYRVASEPLDVPHGHARVHHLFDDDVYDKGMVNAALALGMKWGTQSVADSAPTSAAPIASKGVIGPDVFPTDASDHEKRMYHYGTSDARKELEPTIKALRGVLTLVQRYIGKPSDQNPNDDSGEYLLACQIEDALVFGTFDSDLSPRSYVSRTAQSSRLDTAIRAATQPDGRLPVIVKPDDWDDLVRAVVWRDHGRIADAVDRIHQSQTPPTRDGDG